MGVLAWDEALSRCRLRIRQQSPYFAVLTLFAKYLADEGVELACTDGKITRLHPVHFLALGADEQAGLLLHLTLHAALLHPLRLNTRNPELWNIACDVMVNHIMATQTKLPLPAGTLTPNDIEPGYIPVTAELVYEALIKRKISASTLYQRAIVEPKDAAPTQQQQPNGSLTNASLLRASLMQNVLRQRFEKDALESAKPKAETAQYHQTLRHHSHANGKVKPLMDIVSPNDVTEFSTVRQYWVSAQLNARQRTEKSHGNLNLGLSREWDTALEPQFDWRVLLARFIIQTPTDYSGLDRRFIHRGLYLETLEQETIEIEVAVDTSGSIQDEELNMIATELRSITNTYPHIQCNLYFCDVSLYGPYKLERHEVFPQAKGGGGTDFRPFFEALEQKALTQRVNAAVFFTDGIGTYPVGIPDFPVMWVALPGAPADDEFPFGSVVRFV
jgi:predicted metal-dependent peptidase